jgi:hypothetical protein
MGEKWLFLRGEWDNNNKYNYKHNLDMWSSLFCEISKKDMGQIWFKGGGGSASQTFVPINSRSIMVGFKRPTHIFARGAFPYYIPTLKRFKKAYKVRYAAGKRLVPEKNIRYDLILVDSEKQKKKVQKKFPKLRVEVFFKPAANHFKPMDVEKKYDVGFVAAIPEDRRKRVKWVYKNLPKGLKVLQLGHKPKFKVPKNVKIKHVKSDKMPKMISQCKTIICPYTEDDSGPRIIAEALACDVRPYILDTVPHCYGHHFTFTKNEIWPAILKAVAEPIHSRDGEFLKHYNNNFSMEKAVEHLKGLIL